MTSLRFVGDLSLWLGLLLALLVAVMSWRYYHRESFDLPARLKWLLPLLRSVAFFLGVIILTGPVLHHRTIIGELGRVKIYVDASNSMTMCDAHMSTGRKLLTAEQIGWLGDGKVDDTLLYLADDLANARRELVEQLTVAASRGSLPANDPAEQEAPMESGSPGQIDAGVIKAAKNALLTSLRELPQGLPETVVQRLSSDVIHPLEDLDETDVDTAVSQLTMLAETIDSVESDVQRAFDDIVAQVVNSGDESIKAAITMFDETPRWRRAELGLAGSAADVLAKLREKHDVEVFTLSGARAVPDQTAGNGYSLLGQNSTTGEDIAAPDATVPSFAALTDLSSGITSTRKSVALADSSDGDGDGDGAQPQTAIVLLTDGQHNAGPSPLQSARILGRQGVAFYTVSTGAARQAADLAVVGLEHPEMVFQKDGVRGVMIVRDRMPAGEPYVARISYEDEVLWQQQLLTQSLGDLRIEFEFSIDELIEGLGSQFVSDVKHHTLPLQLEASIAPLPGESETSNNQRTLRLAAITQSYRLLIIDGRSRWETRYLRNVFERDQQWHVDTVIAGPGTDAAALPRGDHDNQFPTTRDQLFGYDLVIFGEIAADLLSDHEYQWLREFVSIRGGGMVFIDGQRGRLRQLTEQNLASLLPVEWVPDVIASRPGSLRLTDRGAAESALQLAVDDQQNRRFWTELPSPHTLVAVAALPGAEVLVEAEVDGQQRPVLVTRAYGAGRILYQAFDETWRWRYKAADIYHQRIWNQLAKFVMPRPFAVSDEYVSIDSGSVSYDSGESVDIRVRLLGLDGKPAIAATADALMWKDGQIVSTVGLSADPDVPGIYRSRTGALPHGEYEVSVRAAGYSESILKARSRFVVLPPESGEMVQTMANESLLRQMAATSGGRYLREEQMYRLPDLLSPLSSGRVVESDTIIWQSYWWFAAVVILLTVEWLLRKRAGLL
ncbi:MAG: hypothetical protein P8K08_24320 [Fuerstiella sp.]|nr:hypothetical protein [Fuerstiella sp.]